MANMGSKGILQHIDDPYTAEIATAAAANNCWVAEGDSGTSFVRAVAVGKGVHYAAKLATGSGDNEEFCSNLKMFAGQEGHSSVEILMQLSRITNMAFFFGLNDDVLDASNTLPAELSGTTFTANAATHLGFVYDTDADNDELHCHWADGGTKTTTTAATLRMVGLAPIASKWLYMKVEMQDLGSGKGVTATFLAVDSNGRSAEKVFDTTVDRTTALCYYYGVENRSSGTPDIYIKHNNWEQTIPNM